jgi:negative regulator of sigma E activity
MKPSHQEILSALIDGEHVPPAELTDALSHPEAAESLLTFARLRSAVLEDRAEPSAKVREALANATRPNLLQGPWRRAMSIALPAALTGAAAAALLVATLRPSSLPPSSIAAGPPPAELVVRFSFDESRDEGENR